MDKVGAKCIDADDTAAIQNQPPSAAFSLPLDCDLLEQGFQRGGMAGIPRSRER